MKERLLKITEDVTSNDEDKIACLEKEVISLDDLIIMNENHESMLHLFLKKDNITLCHWLVKKYPFLLKCKSKDELYPTSIAAYKGCLKLLECFLNEIRDEKEFYKELFLNAVQIAAICGKMDILEFLYNLKPEFDLHVPVYEKNYPIHAAAYNGHLAAVQFLLDKHPNAINEITGFKKRVIDLALMNGNLDLVKFLVQKYQIDLHNTASDSYGMYPFHFAVISNNSGLLQWFFEKGVDVKVETRNAMKQQGIHIAAEYGLIEMVKMLKQQGADINSLNGFGLSPLHLAIIQDRKEVVQYLLENGANISQKTNDELNNNSFHIAAIYGCHDLLDILFDFYLKCNINFNVPNSLGYFPLHYAAIIPKLDIDYLLLKKSIKDSKKKMTFLLEPIEKVLLHMQFPAYKVSTIITSFMTIINELYPSYVFDRYRWVDSNSDYKKVIEWFLDHKVDINQETEDKRGFTLFHFAAAFGNLDILQLLCTKKADIKKAKNGYSPIHLAASLDNVDCVEFLLDYQNFKDWEQSDDYFHTPVTIAIMNKSINTLKFFKQNESKIDEEIKKIRTEWKGIFSNITAYGWKPIHYLSLILVEDSPDIINLEIIDVLLECQVDINAVTHQGETIFYLLIKKLTENIDTKKLDNYMRIISKLIEKDLNIHIKTNYYYPNLENEGMSEGIKETGYDYLLRKLIEDEKYHQILISLFYIFRENGLYIDPSACIASTVNFKNSSLKIEFLNLILQYFPEIYSQVVAKCYEALMGWIDSKLKIPPLLSGLMGHKIESLKEAKKFINYGFMIGRSLIDEELNIMAQLFEADSETFYPAIGIKPSDDTLEKKEKIILFGKPILCSKELNVDKWLPEERLFSLRVLNCFLITPLECLSKEEIHEIKEIFCKLARVTPSIETVSIICLLLDKIIPNPSNKLSDNDILKLKELYIEIYKKVLKEIPTLLSHCEDALIRSPIFSIEYGNKQTFNHYLKDIGTFSKRIQRHREIILNKASLCDPMLVEQLKQ